MFTTFHYRTIGSLTKQAEERQQFVTMSVAVSKTEDSFHRIHPGHQCFETLTSTICKSLEVLLPECIRSWQMLCAITHIRSYNFFEFVFSSTTVLRHIGREILPTRINRCCAKLPTSFLLSYGHTSNPNLNPINNKIWGFIQHSESMRRGSTLSVAAGDCW